MTADELRARILTDLRVAYAVTQADRPDGLTASMLGGCLSYGARTLLAEPKGQSTDVLRALRGTYVHNGMADDLAMVEPEFTDGREQGRFTWDPGEGLPVITGAFDFGIAGVMVDAKTRSRNECRWHADHGPDPNESMQVAVAAETEGYALAAIAYLPTDAGEEEVVVCMVDVAHWTAEARHWLRQVDVRDEYQGLIERGVSPEEARRRVLDSVPRDKPFSWCTLLCERLAACRGDYLAPADLEILDPVMREAAAEAEHWRQVRLDAGRREAAAKSKIDHVEGNVTAGDEELRVTQTVVKPTAGRRGYKRTQVERRAV